jgi:hypothetical protein
VDTEWYTDYARWRGSAAHLATRYYDEGRLDPKTVDDAVKPRLEAWKKFLKATGYQPALIEHRVADEAYRYCATLDRCGRFENDPAENPAVLVEIKNFANGQPPAWVALQLAAQGRALDPTQIFRRIAVMLKPDATYACVEYSLQHYLDDVNDFLAMLRTVRWKQRHSS